LYVFREHKYSIFPGLTAVSVVDVMDFIENHTGEFVGNVDLEIEVQRWAGGPPQGGGFAPDK